VLGSAMALACPNLSVYFHAYPYRMGAIVDWLHSPLLLDSSPQKGAKTAGKEGIYEGRVLLLRHFHYLDGIRSLSEALISVENFCFCVIKIP
jgi:hypothetical protein